MAQNKIIRFPNLTDFISSDFIETNNIIPIAILDLSEIGILDKIPISYSFMDPTLDDKYFLIKGDNIDSYSFKINSDGKIQPLFTQEALLVPNDSKKYLIMTINKVDSVKKTVDLNRLIKFYTKPQWWQNDATPFTEEGKPYKFICQLQLGQITTDDCCLYIFYDSKNKIVKQIFQRD